MPTIKEILGDDLAMLQGQGKSDAEITAIAKQRYKNPPQEQPQQTIPVQQQADTVPAWYKGQSDSGILNFAGDVLRGAGHTGLSYYNALQGGDADTTKILQKLEKITEENKAKGRTPEREAEVKKLQDEYKNAKTFGEKLQAGASAIGDTLTHPKEWQVGEFIGENLDPINVIPAGKGLVAGATLGAMVNGGQGALFSYPRTDKTALDAGVDATLGAIAGGVLGGATGHFTKSNDVSATNESDYKAAMDGLGGNEALSGEVLKGEAQQKETQNTPQTKAQKDEVTLEAEIINKKIDENGMLLNPFETKQAVQKVYHGFAAVINDAEQRVQTTDAEVKQIGSELKAAGASPEQIESAIAAKLLPSPESKAITAIINDDKPVTPRLEGLNLQQAVINSINNPVLAPQDFYASMLKHGFIPEIAKAATDAYVSKDLTYLSKPIHDKLLANVDKLVDVKKIAEETKQDNSFALAHDNLPIEETNTQTQQSALFGNDQQLFDVPSETKLKVPTWAKSLVNNTTSYEDIVKAVTDAKNGEKPTLLAKRAMGAMAKEELKTVEQNPRFKELLDMTRENEGANAPQRLEQAGAGRELDGYGGTDKQAYDAAVYSKNYQYDFSLTKSRVKRIEEGKPTMQDIEYAKHDLDMMEHNPLYALPTEEELRAKFEAWRDNPETIYNFEEYDKLEQKFDPETYAEKQELFGEPTQEEINNDTSYTRDLERNSQNTTATNEAHAGVNADERGASDTGTQQASTNDARSRDAKQSNSSTSNSAADVLGERRDTKVSEPNAADAANGSTAGSELSSRSNGIDGEGVQTEPGREAATSTNTQQAQAKPDNATMEKSLSERITAQKEAESLPIVIGDEKNIHETLPMLLEKQRDDVVKSEKRFYEDDAKGMLFTNGTGTGKTFTGLGIIKRFVRSGKEKIVVLVPSEAKALDWIEDAKLLNLSIRKLKDTKDSGEGDIVITTYENMRDNKDLQARNIDLLVADESHKILGNKNGELTANLQAVRKLTNYYKDALRAANEEFADEKAKIGEDDAQARKDIDDKILNRAMELNKQTKTVFLSASPFASHKALRYADDYLFNFDKNKWSEGEYRGYNAGSDEDLFFIKNFGYRMRYNKLTQPESDVNVDMMERVFAEKLKESGAMSGRMLDVDKDYQRAFVLVENDLGKKIDAGFEALSKDKELPKLHNIMRASYMDTVSLMESIKAVEAVSRIKEHLKLGRKVVIYHTFVNTVPPHPFKFDAQITKAIAKRAKDDKSDGAGNRLGKELHAEYEKFKAKYPELYNLDLGDLDTPPAIIKKAFGDNVVMFNALAKKEKAKNVKKFNDNEVDIIMINESGKEGISLHDKLGDKQRVEINLSLPIKPIDMIQVEGRIYRTGQKSNAIFEYLVLHTNFEKRYFGSNINQRVATVENLALGESSRNLRASIKDGYMGAEKITPDSLTGEGGKAYDARAEGDAVMSDKFEHAKTLYFGKQKGRQNHRGADFFATPDPLGYKMVEWADMKPNDRVLEPSAGVGAIGKWFRADTRNTFIEQSSDLFSDLSVAVAGDVKHMSFEDLDIINKYDAIVMNPPYGRASTTAIAHLQKAMQHTSMNGRIVLLAPNNMMEKAAFRKMLEDKKLNGWVLQNKVNLPEVTFERAGTKVLTSIYVFDKTDAKDRLDISNIYQSDIQADNINEFFDNIKDFEIEKRAHAATPDEVAQEVSVVMRGDLPIEVGVFKHTKTGEDMTVVRLADKLNKEDYKTFAGEVKRFGGYWSRYAKGFLFKDEAKAQHFKDAVNDGSVQLNAVVIPGVKKIVSFFDDWDKKVDYVYDGVSNYLRGVDSEGKLKVQEPSEYKVLQWASNVGEFLRENFVLGGARSDKTLQMLRDMNNHKSKNLLDALKMRDALSHLSKSDSQDLVRALGGDMDKNELNNGLIPIYEKFRKMIDEQTDALVAAGALNKEFAHENYLKRYYFEYVTGSESDFFSIFKGGIKNEGKFKRKEMSLSERIAKGQIEDAGYVVAKTILEQRDQLLRAEFFNELADAYGVDEMQNNYAHVPDITLSGGVKKYGALSGKFVPHEVFDTIKTSFNLREDIGNIEKIANSWVKAVQHIKTNMTVKNPGTHLYNVLSNGYVAYLDGHYTHLARILSDRTYYTQLKEEASRFGLDTMLDDMEAQFFKEHNPNDGALTKLFKNAYMTEDSKLGTWARQAYEFEDVAFKLAAYAKRREALQFDKFLDLHPELKEQGIINDAINAYKYRDEIQKIILSEEELRAAFEEVDSIYVNYGTPLPKGVAGLDRSGLMPFMHYSWKSTPIFLKLMAKHPFKTAALHLAFAAFGADKILGDKEERDKVTPEWMNNAVNLLGVDNFVEVGDSSKYVNIGRSVPGMRFMNLSPVSVLLGMDGGILSNVVGITTTGVNNKGWSVDGHTYDTATQRLVSRSAALTEQIAPPLFPAVPLVVRQKRDASGKEIKGEIEVYAVGGRYFQKAYDALGGKKDKRGNPLSVADVALQSAGLKLQKVDKLMYAQSSANKARKKFVREYNTAASSKERAAAQRRYKDEISAIKKQLPAKERSKLKVSTSLPGKSKRSSTKVFTPKKMIQL